MASVGVRRAAFGILLLLALVPRAGAAADDVPAAVKKQVDEARVLYLKGDAKSLASAFSLLSQAKSKALESVDFWELFARVWRASKKPEADLWEKIVAPREQQVPGAITFDMVRARLETEAAKRCEHLEKAIAKAPDAVEPRLLLSRELKLAGEEVKAEEAVDALLEKQPDLEAALVAKAELMLEGGLSQSAITLLKESLARKDQPGVRYALALALRRVAGEQEDKSMHAAALEEAQKAVAGRPDPAHVATLADLLDEAERMPEAVALLKKHVASGADPRLTQRLGAFAFRAGEYDAAAAQLKGPAATDVKAAKALALCHARRGRAKEAHAAADQVLALDKEAWEFAAGIAWDLEDAAMLRKRTEGRSGENVATYRAAADAFEGKAAAAQAALAEPAASGSRGGEESLLLLLRARLREKLGPKNAAYRALSLDVMTKTLATPVPSAKPDGKPLLLSAKSQGFMQRAVTYYRSVCGQNLEAGDGNMVGTLEDGELSLSLEIQGTSACRAEPVRAVRFLLGKGGHIELTDDAAGWKEASEAFKEGSAALVAGDATKAVERFGKAFEKEPGWQRAKLFKLLAAAFLPTADLATAAKEALEAAAVNPDDWNGRATAILLGHLAGIDATVALTELYKHVDARSHPPIDTL